MLTLCGYFVQVTLDPITSLWPYVVKIYWMRSSAIIALNLELISVRRRAGLFAASMLYSTTGDAVSSTTRWSNNDLLRVPLVCLTVQVFHGSWPFAKLAIVYTMIIKASFMYDDLTKCI